MGFRLWLSLAPLALTVSALGQETPSFGPQELSFFENDVRPILKTNCEACHNPANRSSGLSLDSRENVLKGGRRGPAAQPGVPTDSLLIRAVEQTGDLKMPLGRPRLADQDIATLRQWIDQKLPWPVAKNDGKPRNWDHWAFQTPKRPPVPAVSNAAWVRNPIDNFILTKLEQEKLDPSPEADRATLLRRVSLDLTGLPPTPQEIEAFLADQSPQAYDKVVDRLLASPHYGERWGRHWLDAARYADSDGYEKDKLRFAWFYRDWVINALNQDLPYDRFVIEQIAGDLLPNPTQSQLVATGFLRNSMINEEGGIDPEQFRMEAMYDRMDAIGKGILGVTIQCAQCHNHKYDPIKQEEYYRIFAFLNDTHESNIAVYTADQQMKRAEIFRRTREIEAELQHRNPDWVERMAEWEAKAKVGQPEWTVVQPVVDDISNGGQKYLPLKDGSFLAQGYAPTKHKVKMTIKTDVQNITAFRLELLNDPNLPMGGPGRSVKGTGALTEFEVEAAPASAPDRITKIKIAKATADVNPPETPLEAIFDDKSGKRRVTGPVEFAIDGNEDTAWGIDAGPGLRNQPRKAVFTAEAPIANRDGTILTFYLDQKHGGWNSDDNQNQNLGRFRLSITTAPGAVADPLPRNVRDIIAIPREQRTPAQMAAVFAYWRTTVPEWRAANEKITGLWRDYPEGSSQLVLAAREDPRETHILTRGDFLKPSKAVGPGVPAFLHPLPKDAPATRLTFARWLVDRN